MPGPAQIPAPQHAGNRQGKHEVPLLKEQLEVDALAPSGEAVEGIPDRFERLVADPQANDRAGDKAEENADRQPDAEELAGAKRPPR